MGNTALHHAIIPILASMTEPSEAVSNLEFSDEVLGPGWVTHKFDKVLEISENRDVSVAEKCDGYIDAINGVSPTPLHVSVSGLLNVRGWLAKSAEEGLLPDSVLLVLKSSKGGNTFIETHKTPRPDVGAYFKKPTLNPSGYESTADVSAIVGNYTLGVAFAEGNHIEICPQFKVPADLKGMAPPVPP